MLAHIKFLSILAILDIIIKCCSGRNINSGNDSSTAGFLHAGIATWYRNPTGGGSDGGAAGNNGVFNSGKGCGACFQVKCTECTACSGNPITLTITDQCPVCENNRLDLSGKAFGSLASAGQAVALREKSTSNIKGYHVNITPLISSSGWIRVSNPNYLAFVMEFVNGGGDLGVIELQASNSNAWMPMQLSNGATWKIDQHNGEKGPFSVRLPANDSKISVVASQVIPEDWAPGGTYQSGINF